MSNNILETEDKHLNLLREKNAGEILNGFHGEIKHIIDVLVQMDRDVSEINSRMSDKSRKAMEVI